MKVRIVGKANEWNHPAGMWWDAHLGETFTVTQTRPGIPTQHEVDVSHLNILGGVKRAWVIAAYVEEVNETISADAGDTRSFAEFVRSYENEWRDGEWGWETLLLKRILARLEKLDRTS